MPVTAMPLNPYIYQPLGLKNKTPRPAGWSPEEERSFQEWMTQIAAKNNTNPNPDEFLHRYNYPAAYRAGQEMGGDGHMSSRFKMLDHPNRYVVEDGRMMDSITGQPQFPPDNPYKWALMRARMAADDPMQSVIAPLEHREFTYDVGRNQPWYEALAQVPAIPAYSALKWMLNTPGAPVAKKILGGTPRSPASLDEVFGAYEGLFSGLKDRFTGDR